MKTIRTKAIVIRRTNYGEADRILQLLTPDYGKVSVMARGVRREKSKLAGGIELFAQLRRRDDVVRLGVRDYGPRISQTQWRSIQKSHEAHASTRPDSSGLGLAISSQFADAIGARVGAIRHKDGASFYVDVPVSKQLSLL